MRSSLDRESSDGPYTSPNVDCDSLNASCIVTVSLCIHISVGDPGSRLLRAVFRGFYRLWLPLKTPGSTLLRAVYIKKKYRLLL